jgi:hypothetical protein
LVLKLISFALEYKLIRLTVEKTFATVEKTLLTVEKTFPTGEKSRSTGEKILI